MFDVEFDGLTDALGTAIADDCATARSWPVAFVPGRVEKRWFGIEKAFPPVLEVLTEDEAGPILAPDAARDEEAIALRPAAIDALARTVTILAAHLPDGFVFRATWSGSPILHDEHLSIAELARRIRASGLNEFTRYYVEPTSH